MKKENFQIEKHLKIIGLSDNEIAVYVAILKLGKGVVSQIARKAFLNRTTAYDILNRLVAKKLISISGKEPKQEYMAESPDQLKLLIKEELGRRQLELNEVEKVIPELKSIHNVMGRPQVRFYEGVEGLETVYEDTLTSHEPIRGYATVDEMHNGLPGYFPKYYKRRAAAGINIRAIIPKTEIGLERSAHDKEELRETALIPLEKYGFHPEINIYDNKVMIASWREKLGIIIESAEIADAMKKIYELAWNESRRLDAEIRKEAKSKS